jgi:hypothetical protein
MNQAQKIELVYKRAHRVRTESWKATPPNEIRLGLVVKARAAGLIDVEDVHTKPEATGQRLGVSVLHRARTKPLGPTIGLNL